MSTLPPRNYTRVSAERYLLPEAIAEGMFMSVSECERIKKRVNDIREPLQWPKTAAWTAGSIGIAALLALFPWNATYDLLTDTEKLAYSWVGTTFLLIAAFSVVVIFGAVLFHRSNRDEIARDKKAVLDLIEAIEERYQREERNGTA
jgi:hypothetical protein